MLFEVDALPVLGGEQEEEEEEEDGQELYFCVVLDDHLGAVLVEEEMCTPQYLRWSSVETWSNTIAVICRAKDAMFGVS